jgi:hypothetical protein
MQHTALVPVKQPSSLGQQWKRHPDRAHVCVTSCSARPLLQRPKAQACEIVWHAVLLPDDGQAVTTHMVWD